MQYRKKKKKKDKKEKTARSQALQVRDNGYSTFAAAIVRHGGEIDRIRLLSASGKIERLGARHFGDESTRTAAFVYVCITCAL